MQKKILIVDDDPVSNKVIISYLKEANYVVDEKTNALDAWELLLKHPHEYGLILLDRMMFGVDGMELLQRIKNHAELKTIPVIMLTGEAEPEEHVAAVAAGVVEFIYKPIEKDLLLFLVRDSFKPPNFVFVGK